MRLIEEEVAFFLGDVLLERYPQLLTARYGFKTEGLDGIGVVEQVAARRGFRVRGGEFDVEKAAHVLLHDYRSGAIGRISLETPESRAARLAVHAAEKAEKERLCGRKGGGQGRRSGARQAREPERDHRARADLSGYNRAVLVPACAIRARS